jgi:3-oxoacyl-[acyl-carrier-protein] synthase-3
MATYAHIVGWGKYVPEKVVTNDDIAQFMDTSDGWIKSRTGISERRFASEDETTASMAITAAKVALDRARLTPASIDLIIVATLSPEYIFPSTACLVQDAIGATHAGAYDLSAACAGFIYAMSMASAMIQSGAIKTALVIGSETVSRFLDDQDRTTYPLFGDGAGALVLQAAEEPGGVLATVLGADGSGAEYLVIPAGGSKMPTSQESVDNRLHYIKMNGREVYRFATRVMGRAAKQACAEANIDLTEIDLFIPHQANIRIIDAAAKRLGIPMDRFVSNVDRYGNTSTASIPIALDEAVQQSRIHPGDVVVLVGFGAGLTWGAAVLRW